MRPWDPPPGPAGPSALLHWTCLCCSCLKPRPICPLLAVRLVISPGRCCALGVYTHVGSGPGKGARGPCFLSPPLLCEETRSFNRCWRSTSSRPGPHFRTGVSGASPCRNSPPPPGVTPEDTWPQRGGQGRMALGWRWSCNPPPSSVLHPCRG